MKKSVILFIFVILITPTILASVNVTQNNLETGYLAGEDLRGKLGLEIVEEELGSIISTNKGHQILLED